MGYISVFMLENIIIKLPFPYGHLTKIYFIAEEMVEAYSPNPTEKQIQSRKLP